VSLKDIIESYNPAAPLAQASTIPAAWYSDPELAELERQTVFARSWQLAARVTQIEKPGQYVTCEVAGERIVVVRGDDGELRGFFNVCRHHAAAVANGDCGEVPELKCPYHGWTYSLEGDLKSAPDLGAVREFDRKSNGLVRVPTAIWKHWVFVKIEGAGEPPIRIPGLNLRNLHWFERRRYLLDCNWKVFVDNYLDGGYHVPHLHKSLDRLLNYPEYQIELGDRYCLQCSPYRESDRALYYWIYPNLMINRYPDAMDTNLVVPRGLTKTEVIFDFFFTDVSEGTRARNAASVAVSEKIQEEDVSICESVQHGLSSRAYTAGRLSARREAGEHLFHRLLYMDLKSGSDRFDRDFPNQ
jgi:choline monooxygenase